MSNPMATLISLSDRMTPAMRDEFQARFTEIIDHAKAEDADPEAVHSMELCRAWICSPEFRARVSALTSR